MMGKEAVVKKLAIHNANVANAIELPLTLFGNISESATQVTGPSVAA
jgi:hypothetical protein